MAEPSPEGSGASASVRHLVDEPFFQQSIDLLCVATLEGRFALLNPRWTEVLGWPMDTLYATPFLDFVHPEDVEPTVDAMGALGDGEEILEFTNRYRCADGSHKHLAWRATVARDGLIYASARDLSPDQRRRAEVLRFSEALNSTEDFIAVVDANNLRFSWVNQGAVDSTGYSRQELLQKAAWDLEPLRTEATYRARVQPLLDGSLDRLQFESQHQHCAGRLLDVDVLIQASRVEGQALQLVTVVRDITARKQAERELQAHAMALEDAARFDRAENRILASFSSLEGLGTVLENVLEGLAQDLDFPLSAVYVVDDWRGALTQAAARGVSTSLAQEIELGDGLIGDVAANRRAIVLEDPDVSPFPVDAGRLEVAPRAFAALPLVHRDRLLGVLLLASARALTDNHRAFFDRMSTHLGVALHNARQYEDLRELSAQLQARGREVSRKNLELRQADRLKSEFLANMSHELRTPLNAIIGFSEVLRDGLLGELDAPQVEYLSEIFTAGEHLLSLINDILDLSKVEAGRMDLEPEEVHLRDVLEASATVIRERATQGGVDVVVHCEDMPSFVADLRKVKQITYNLASNAVKFTPRGGTVTLRGRAEGDVAILEVHDTGIGIAPADQGRLFDPFVQLDGSSSRRFEGTGLGLALVSRFVALHGGTVEVESDAGAGAMFRVRLPRNRPAAPGGGSLDPAPSLPVPGADPVHSGAGSRAGLPGSIRDLGPQRRGPARLLLVDDDPRAHRVIAACLEDDQFELVSAFDGAQGLELARLEPPDAIVLDLMMPGANGFDVLESLSLDPQLRDIPVVVMTSKMLSNEELARLQEGTEQVFEKAQAPVREVIARVKTLMARRGTA